MPTFFPRHPIELHLEEPAAFRRLSFSLVPMALLTGAGLRVFRALALILGASSWIHLTALALGLLLFIAMATAHLGNYPVSRWAWRAPAFGALEAAAEMAVSALLIAVGQEPLGTARAQFDDWPAMALQTLGVRLLAISCWSLLLAAVVVLVRSAIARRLKKEHAERVG